MTLRSPWRALAGALVLALPAQTQTEVLVATGDSFPGFGVVDEVLDLAIDDQGQWLAVVQSGFQHALIHDGVLIAQHGDALQGAGKVFTSAACLGFDDQGGFAWIARHPSIAGVPATGVYHGLEKVLESGDLMVLPGVPPGTYYDGFLSLEVEPSGSLLVVANGLNPSVSGFWDEVLLRLTPQVGGGWSPSMVYGSGQLLPGATDLLHDLTDHAHGMQANSHGQLLSFLGFQATGDAIWLDLLPVASTGGLTPILGRTWQVLDRMPMALNDTGSYAFGGLLTGDVLTHELLVKNGSKVVQQGDMLAVTTPYQLDDLGLGGFAPSPLYLSDTSTLFWHGSWSDPDPNRDSAIFADLQPVVRESHTWIDGATVTELTGFDFTVDRPVFAVTSDGQQLAFRATLSDGRTGAFRVHPFGSLTTLPGCVPNAGGLTILGGAPKLGGLAMAKVTAPQTDGVYPILFASAAPNPDPCGTAVPGLGEVLIDLSPGSLLTIFPTGFPAVFGITFLQLGVLPNDPTLFGQTVYLQALWADLTGVSPTEPLRLTEGIAVTVGH